MGHNHVYRVTQNPQEFHRLTGCQRDPRIWGVTDPGTSKLPRITQASIAEKKNRDTVAERQIAFYTRRSPLNSEI